MMKPGERLPQYLGRPISELSEGVELVEGERIFGGVNPYSVRFDEQGLRRGGFTTVSRSGDPRIIDRRCYIVTSDREGKITDLHFLIGITSIMRGYNLCFKRAKEILGRPVAA